MISRCIRFAPSGIATSLKCMPYRASDSGSPHMFDTVKGSLDYVGDRIR